MDFREDQRLVYLLASKLAVKNSKYYIGTFIFIKTTGLLQTKILRTKNEENGKRDKVWESLSYTRTVCPFCKLASVVPCVYNEENYMFACSGEIN